MKTRGLATQNLRVSGTRGRTVSMCVEQYQPEYGQSWWMWAGRISSWVTVMVGLVVALIVLGMVL